MYFGKIYVNKTIKLKDNYKSQVASVKVTKNSFQESIQTRTKPAQVKY